MRLTLNISPCPNDTFMFDALINGRIDTRGVEFDVRFADIEQLNQTVCCAQVDVSKISYAILPQITNHYALLDSASALGRGNGPLLVGRNATLGSNPQVAIPGEHTTANMLMHKLFPEVTNKTAILFSQIAEAVESGVVDAGVLIHEGRFTYHERGLKLIADLGHRWEQESGLALPLGAIVVNRRLPHDIQQTVQQLINESVQFAFDNPDASSTFVAEHAQEMSSEVIHSHIALFVNQYSLSLGIDGRRAVEALLGVDTDKIMVGQNG